jgi:hypothetical protein
VVNTPLPVTANVAGTVQAQQNGPWNVGIAGTPNVNVVSSLASPLFSREVGDVSNSPYVRARIQTLGGGQNAAALEFFVPDGTRLIIESVTVGMEVPPGQRGRVELVLVRTETFVSLSVEPQGVVDQFEHLIGTHPLKLRVDGEGPEAHAIEFRFRRSPADFFWSVRACVSGYLVGL